MVDCTKKFLLLLWKRVFFLLLLLLFSIFSNTFLTCLILSTFLSYPFFFFFFHLLFSYCPFPFPPSPSPPLPSPSLLFLVLRDGMARHSLVSVARLALSRCFFASVPPRHVDHLLVKLYTWLIRGVALHNTCLASLTSPPLPALSRLLL